MEPQPLVDTSRSSRELLRAMRREVNESTETLPESVAWHLYLELKRREEPSASDAFIQALRGLHSRRSFAGTDMPTDDSDPDEHRQAEDPFLADLWKAYKKCIRANRTGPAAQLLRDIEEQVAAK